MPLHFNQRTLRALLVGFAVLAVASTAWRYRHHELVQAVLRPGGAGGAPIRFDNGSVRDGAPRPAASGTDPGLAAENEPGKLKKCIRGKEVLYTDQACGAGARVAAIEGGNVTVLPSPPSAAKAPGRAEPPTGRRTLHEALDVSGSEELRGRMMERSLRP
ncbi:hypothetical protein [Simplicispira lacusdiani]|uniref:hypothetical protein n=1 Tax=Simplicispira lacusdiani TaxID=2213010 RepID=UPI000E76606A|nr:hypothetical protein [Simplicispira lacusdiani]